MFLDLFFVVEKRFCNIFMCFCHICLNKGANCYFNHCRHSKAVWHEFGVAPLPFFFHSSLILNAAINTACVVPPADPPFAIALVLQPRDWDIFIPVLCTSQAPSIILLKSALSWKLKGGGCSWWLFHGIANLFTSFHSCCAPTLPNMTFCNVVYHFVLYGQQAYIL